MRNALEDPPVTAPNASKPSLVARATSRHSRRALAALAISAGAAFGLSACGAGQISQTASQVPAVNGTEAKIGALDVRDAQIMFPQDANQKPGTEPTKANLTFTVANGNPGASDRLTGVEITGATATVAEPDKAIILGGQSLTAALPSDEQPTNPASTPIHIAVTDLSDSIRPGLNVPITLDFESAGQLHMTVPVTVFYSSPRQGG